MSVRLALRQHSRQRGFALTVCTLALTSGATTAVFSVVNAVLVRRSSWITGARRAARIDPALALKRQ